MWITFTRKRLKVVLEALEEGRYIACPQEGGKWTDDDLLAVAGACLCKLMVRREIAACETTDEPLKLDLGLPFNRPSARLRVALNYALYVASSVNHGCGDDEREADAGNAAGDKTYKVDVFYDHPKFRVMCPAQPRDPDNPDGPPPGAARHEAVPAGDDDDDGEEAEELETSRAA